MKKNATMNKKSTKKKESAVIKLEQPPGSDENELSTLLEAVKKEKGDSENKATMKKGAAVKLEPPPDSDENEDNYTLGTLLEVVEKVRSRSMKLHDAALKYQIPKTTLLRKLRGYQPLTPGDGKVNVIQTSKNSDQDELKKKKKANVVKRAYGTKNNYSQAKLEEALKQVRSGAMRICDVVTEYKIPRHTLYHKLNGKHLKKIGRPFSLTGSKKLMLKRLREDKKAKKVKSERPKRKKKGPGEKTRAYGTKNNYTQTILEEALKKARSGTMNLSDVSTKYNIPRATLYHKLRDNHSKKVGRPVTLSDSEDADIRDQALALIKSDIAITISDLRVMVKNFLDKEGKKVIEFKNNLPGVTWSSRFLSRYPILKENLTLIHPLKRVHKKQFTYFYANLAEKLKDVSPENIYTIDESGFGYNLDNPHMFYRQDRHPEITKDSTKSSFTVVSCGSAVGDLLHPYFIFMDQDNLSEWMQDAPEGSRMSVSNSGWINAEIFEDWLEQHFIPFVEARREKKVIICDYLSAHISSKALELCLENNIIFICLLPNWPYLLQPLKIKYFPQFEAHWCENLKHFLQSTSGESNTKISINQFASLIRKTLALNKTTSSDNLVAGYRLTGIYPITNDTISKKLPAKYFANKHISYNLPPKLEKKPKKNNVDSDLDDCIPNLQITQKSFGTKEAKPNEKKERLVAQMSRKRKIPAGSIDKKKKLSTEQTFQTPFNQIIYYKKIKEEVPNNKITIINSSKSHCNQSTPDNSEDDGVSNDDDFTETFQTPLNQIIHYKKIKEEFPNNKITIISSSKSHCDRSTPDNSEDDGVSNDDDFKETFQTTFNHIFQFKKIKEEVLNNKITIISSSESHCKQSIPEKRVVDDVSTDVFEEIEFLDETAFELEDDSEFKNNYDSLSHVKSLNVGDFCLIDLEESIFPAKIESTSLQTAEVNVLQKLNVGWGWPRKALKICIGIEDIIHVIDSEMVSSKNSKFIIKDKLLFKNWGD